MRIRILSIIINVVSVWSINSKRIHVNLIQPENSIYQHKKPQQPSNNFPHFPSKSLENDKHHYKISCNSKDIRCNEINNVSNDFHQFIPIPNIKVKSLCRWEVNYTNVANRIPNKITEIICSSEDSSCGNREYFCRQVNVQMTVGYYEKANQYSEDWYALYQRNLTIGVGCSCVLKTQPTFGVLYGSAPLEKKRSFAPLNKKILV
ncbi:unnamed protein product [Lepeophtheirus salmonis]|uniref:(salmon louse) hypothetical protein n=1 Tax=Lepeophtheirus salmonis TaxID=72036 RepID=A0A7R8D6P3_LEPSM|nr:unnamed protein product [Lepeophtheirus salmonis]CAF3046743.1 unnamed protein product [Lepeophtheirus salmonis]